MAGYLALKGLTVLRNGYKIIPIPLGQKFPILRAWQTIDATPEIIGRWLRNDADAGIGILCGEISCWDCDIRDEAVMTEMEQYAYLKFGMAPVRIGNYPKRCLMYRARTPFRKISSRKWVDSQGREHQIEILGIGNQFVAFHIHPDTGKPFRWDKGDGPEFVRPEDLPEITEEGARAFIAHFEELAAARGWTPLGAAAASPAANPSIEGDDDDELDLAAEKRKPLGWDDDKLEKLVMSIPNDDSVPYQVDRDRTRLGWIETLMAIHHETGGSEFGRELALQWSELAPKHRSEEFVKTWNSFGKRDHDRPMTARYIKKWAKIEKEKADQRPEIHVRAGELDVMATEAERALIEQGAPLYSRGQSIVRPVVEEVDATRNRRTKVARLIVVSPPGLIDYMSRSAKWIRYDLKQKKDVRTDPPTAVAPIVLSRDGEWSFKRLTGVITTPTIRPDGSVFSDPGYDPATGLLLLQPPPTPTIPTKPTKDQAAGELRKLDRLLDEFPFVDKASRSVALSGLITPLVRGAVRVAPLHAITAPTPGSGKSYIVDLAAGIAMGRICPVISAGWSEEEMEKRVGAILLAGQQIVAIDNLNGFLQGDFLCQVVERPVVDVRILGKSEVVKIENRATLFSTGNNLVIRGDLIRRVVQCALDPCVERPELREFKGNPFDRIIAHRGEYIAAVLTVVRAYIEAGRPGELKALASFEGWSSLVRSALVWLGYADPVATMDRVRDEDPEIKLARRIVNTWLKAVGADRPMLISELISAANGVSDTSGDGDMNFSQALAELDRRGHVVSSQSFGYWLRRYNGRIIDGLKILSKEDKRLKQQLWWLADMDPL